VHVFSADAEAKIALGARGEAPRLLENRRMTRADLTVALNGAREHQAMLLQKWSEIHGRLGK
jgi:Domain of unknown function (DUF4160)